MYPLPCTLAPQCPQVKFSIFLIKIIGYRTVAEVDWVNCWPPAVVHESVKVSGPDEIPEVGKDFEPSLPIANVAPPYDT